MSKANRVASRVALSSSALDGYVGYVDVLTYRKRTWWQRLLRLRARRTQQRFYANGKGSTARLWRRT